VTRPSGAAVAAALAVALLAAPACRPARTESRAAPAPPASVVFFDDFSGPALDRRSWTVRVTGPTYNEEQQAYVDAGATVRVVRGDTAAGASDGGALLLWQRGGAHEAPGRAGALARVLGARRRAVARDGRDRRHGERR
jgi:hypothetical protein